LSPELQLLTANSLLWQPAMAIQHTWSTGTAEVATRAGKFAKASDKCDTQQKTLFPRKDSRHVNCSTHTCLWPVLTTMSGYPGCRQPEETVLLGGLTLGLETNCIKQLQRKLVQIILQELPT